MSCGDRGATFLDCVPNPIEGLTAETYFQDVPTTAIFSINLAMYIFYALLVIWIGYFLFKTIYSLYGGGHDESETYEKFRNGLTNAVFAAIGLVLLVSARFFIIILLRLIGYSDPASIFNF